MTIEITREEGLVIVIGKEEAKRFIMKLRGLHPGFIPEISPKMIVYDRVCSDLIVQQIREFAKD